MAYSLLGEIIETVTGRKFATVLDRRIARPLGLGATGTRLTKQLQSTLATGYCRQLPGEPARPIAHSEAAAFEAASGPSSSCVGDLLTYQRPTCPATPALSAS